MMTSLGNEFQYHATATATVERRVTRTTNTAVDVEPRLELTQIRY